MVDPPVMVDAVNRAFDVIHRMMKSFLELDCLHVRDENRQAYYGYCLICRMRVIVLQSWLVDV